MNPWINYHHLYYFKIIAEEGTVSAAAKKLRLGQPTLSSQLKQFEDAIGFSLFERRKKRLFLTEHGEMALEYAREIFKMGSEMLEVLQDRPKPQKSTLHLGALDSVPKRVVSQIVRRALKLAPCRITLSEGRPEELLKGLLQHRMDLVIMDFLPNGLDRKELAHCSISVSEVGFFGAQSFRRLRSGFPRSIEGEPVILPTFDSKLRGDLENWAEKEGVSLNVVIETQDVAVKKLMAVHGLGLIPAAIHSVAGLVKNKELFEIGKTKGIQEELYLISARRKIENPIAKIIRKSFRVE
jgi:LysR family transcriptional activator of nhaA